MAAAQIMTTEPTPLVTVLPCEADSGMSGDAIAQAEMFWSNLPTGNRPWTSLQTSEKALVCYMLSRQRLEALAEMQDEVVAAYKQGALDVHNNWQEDRDPDFTEAAHDYASSRTAIRALSNKTGKGSNS